MIRLSQYRAEKARHSDPNHYFENYRKLTHEENFDLLCLFHNPATSQREKQNIKEVLVVCNMRLVYWIAANKYFGYPLEEMVQSGSIGLQRAVEKFDTCKRANFATYAYLWIRSAISREIENNSRTVRLPEQVHKSLGHLTKAIGKYIRANNGQRPTPGQMADILGWDVEKVKDVWQATKSVNSYDKKLSEDGDSFLDLLSCPSTSEDSLFYRQATEQLDELMSEVLKPLSKTCLEMHLGVYGPPVEYADIAHELGMEPTQVKRKCNYAKKILRKPRNKAKMQSFLVV